LVEAQATPGMLKSAQTPFTAEYVLGSPGRLEGRALPAQLIHQGAAYRVIVPGGRVGSIFGNQAARPLGPVDDERGCPRVQEHIAQEVGDRATQPVLEQ